MGMIWRSTMPLLSTLAALVIIVHSAEELDRGYRRELRPRAVDTASYEQPWKAIDGEPVVQQSTRAQVWNESPEEAPEWRRPVRKRKRRPYPYPEGEPQERYQESIQGTHHDAVYHDSQQTPETVRKRRKRPDTNYHLPEGPVSTEERPLRRRGLRRKRPNDYEPQMAELVGSEPAEYFENEKRTPNYQFNEYDETEHTNTEKTKVYLKVDIDNVGNRHKALGNNAENIDVSTYNRTFGSEEQSKVSGHSNTKVYAALPFYEASSSAADEPQDEKPKTNPEVSNEPSSERITEKPKSVSESNADIMTMIKKSKEKKLKLGIIINGTEQSYFPLPIPADVADTDYDSTATTEKSNGTIKAENNGTEKTVFPGTISAAEFIVADGNFKSTEKANDVYNSGDGDKKPNYVNLPITSHNIVTVIIPFKNSKEIPNNIFNINYGSKESNYLSSPNTVNNIAAANDISDRNIEKSKAILPIGNEPNNLSFAMSSRKFVKMYTKANLAKANSVFNLENIDEEQNYFNFPKPINTISVDSYYWTDNNDKSYVLINGGTEQNNLVFPIPKKDFTDYAYPKKVIQMHRNGKVKYDNLPPDDDMQHFKKWINTNKWISKIKQIPRITLLEFNELQPMDEPYEENGVIDPMMLKQILKRSNGSSLSEMLQRHNLSLSDLLQGRDEAITALNMDASGEPRPQLHGTSRENTPQLKEAESKYPTIKQTSTEQKVVPKESSSDEDTNETTTTIVETVTDKDITEKENQSIKPRMSTKRRFPNGIRRKLRMRPTLNSTLKAQLSRDLIALTARKYSQSNRNVSKSREWKDIVPLMVDRSKDVISKDDSTETVLTTTDTPVETTSSLEISNTSYSLSSTPDTSNINDNEVENTVLTTTEATTTITIEVTPPFEIENETERPKITPIVRPAANNSVLRRQAFNNRLKRKRLKQKSSTTENPSDDLMKNFLGMANLVSASQFIERTQKPYTTTKQDNTEFATELEDFMTTQTPATVDSGVKTTQVDISRSTSTTTTKSLPHTSTSYDETTEQSAKFEIEEILNDTMTSERLAKILRERNMTLSELVNHRERGSSHVHLADIFHNASKEPNPPEPFLTKSSIEPISKETYPLRAILEATHETTTRPVPSQADQKNYLHIPVVMDFGNNVNENGESMGIISLFNKLTDSEVTIDKTQIRKDSDGMPYVSSVISVNTTSANDTNRESRVLTNSEDWGELLSFMKEHNISTFEEDLQALNKGDIEKESSEEDLDGDGLMVLDDLQHLQNFESNIAPASGENIEMKMYERREHLSEKPGILNKLPNNTKSVAIATASILGLAAVLFLLTYIAFKWKQQRNKLKKKESFCVDQIPSPVFENRKSHKNNCSSRSISPMISSTNIYMSTLESQNGKESPDYMWNSLRKPFQ